MEDDQIRKEDDLRKIKSQEEPTKGSGKVSPPPSRMVTEKDSTTPPPPPRHSCPGPNEDGGVSLDNAEQLSPLYREGGKAVVSQPRATCSSGVIQTDGGTDRTTFGKKVANCVTVNGMKLTELQKMKTTIKKTSNNKKNSDNSVKKKKIPLPTVQCHLVSKF